MTVNEPKNADLRAMIRDNKLTQKEVAKYLTNQSGRSGEIGRPLSGGALRKRLDNDLTAEQRLEIIAAIERALADSYGII